MNNMCTKNEILLQNKIKKEICCKWQHIFNSKIDDLKERITKLENEKLGIEERLNVFEGR